MSLPHQPAPEIITQINRAERDTMMRMQAAKQKELLIRQFINVAAKDLYCQAVQGSVVCEGNGGEDDLRLLARWSQRAALILAETLGMVSRTDLHADDT